MSIAKQQEAEKRIAADEWDLESWQTLCACAGASSYPVGSAIYERLQHQFPTAGKFWRAAAEHARRENVPEDQIRAIYEKGVQNAGLSVELWASYVHFIKDKRGDVAKVLERAFSVCGLDLNVHTLWNEYVDYVEGGTASADQKRDVLRSIYQRAIANPMNNVDTFWRAYEAFESSNPTLSAGLLATHQPSYIAARTEARARKHRMSSLSTATLATAPRGRTKDVQLAASWRKFISLELSNLHELDDNALASRVCYAYEAALVVLYRYPDIWVAYADYLTKIKKDLQAADRIMDRARNALPGSVAVASAAADAAIRRKDTDKAVRVLEKLVNSSPTVLGYIELMKIVRRVQSQEAGRSVFLKARKALQESATYQLYVSAALMEYNVNKDKKLARNVFEYARKKFPTCTKLAYEYVGFLWNINEWEYAKVVLESVLKKSPGDRRLWDRYVEYESIVGDTASLDKLYERRNTECNIDSEPPIARVIAQASFRNLLPLSSNEMEVIENLSLPMSHMMNGEAIPSARLPSSTNNGGPSRTAASRTRAPVQPSVGGLPNELESKLFKLAASMPPIAVPPPEPEFVFSQLLQIPDDFTDTPAGKRQIPGVPNSTGFTAGVTTDLSGTKRAAEAGQEGSIQPPQPQPTVDLFRARQQAGAR